MLVGRFWWDSVGDLMLVGRCNWDGVSETGLVGHPRCWHGFGGTTVLERRVWWDGVGGMVLLGRYGMGSMLVWRCW